jgi:hypothetical protein
VTSSRKLWSFDQRPDVPTPATDGTSHLVNDKGIAWCLRSPTGKALYGPQRLAPAPTARPRWCGRAVYVTSETGSRAFTRPVRFGASAENPLEDVTISSPAGWWALYLRTAHKLWALGNVAKGSASQ